jgi:hypothetical protein
MSVDVRACGWSEQKREQKSMKENGIDLYLPGYLLLDKMGYLAILTF